MTKPVRRPHGIPWSEALLSIVSVLIGLLAQPAAEAIVPPLFQARNLPTIVFFVACALFLVGATYAITLSNAGYRCVQETFGRIDDLASSIGVRVTVLLDGSDAVKRAYPLMARLVRNAMKEILVLDYLPVAESGDIVGHELKKSSPDRAKYYGEIQNKLLTSVEGGFRYHRVIQIADTRSLGKVVGRDEILREHCRTLITIAATNPEFVTLKLCEPFFDGTIMIIDQRYVIWNINALDPSTREFCAQCVLFFDDPIGELVRQVLRLFRRIDANATLAHTSALEPTED